MFTPTTITTWYIVKTALGGGTCRERYFVHRGIRTSTPSTTEQSEMLLHLLAHLALVEGEFRTLQDVAINAAALAGAGRDAREEAARVELESEGLVNGALGGVLGDAALDVVGLLDVGLILALFLLGGALLVQLDSVVALVPRAERLGVNLDDGVLDEGLGADELVVRGVVDNIEDAALASADFRAPGEVASVEAEGAELAVAAAGADLVHALLANASVRGRATELVLALALVDDTLTTGVAALVARVTRDTHHGSPLRSLRGDGDVIVEVG